MSAAVTVAGSLDSLVAAAPQGSRAWRHFRRDTRGWLGLGVVVALVVLAIAAPLVATDPIRISLVDALEPPSASHWLGTDVQGRDVWSRLVYGARVSLLVGLVSQGIALTLGVGLGLVAGYYGRWVDETRDASRRCHARIPVAAAAHRDGGCVLALTRSRAASPSAWWDGRAWRDWYAGSRSSCGNSSTCRPMRALGARDVRILLRHVLPNVARRCVIAATLGLLARSWRKQRCRFSGLACSHRRQAGAR